MTEKFCSMELANEIIGIRRQLHQFPELSFQEYKTSIYICEILDSWGIPFQRIGDTGVYVDIQGTEKGPAIGLRADIDALPIAEESNVSFSSQVPNVMHACGHDGHTAILLGTVNVLHKNKNRISGLVRCVFQPGEEADGAAKLLIEQGILQNPQLSAMIGLHVWPHLPLGSIGVKSGNMTASCDDFIIRIHGKGGHCARPQQGVDVITIASQFIQSLQAIAVKKFSPTEPVIMHIGRISAGEANNVIASSAELEGTLRALSAESRKNLRADVEKICTSLGEQWGVYISVEFIEGAPPIVNDPILTDVVKSIGEKLLGSSNVYELPTPSMGADDFGYFSEEVASHYFRLGIKKEDEVSYDLHHPKFQFDDDVLKLGVDLFASTAIHLGKMVEESNDNNSER